MSPTDKPLVWLHGEVKTPPMTQDARVEAGYLLRRLQQGHTLSMPRSRPMPSIGKHVHELRITDADAEWRVVYRLDADAIVVLEVFRKQTRATPPAVIRACQVRLRAYDAIN
ncbi:MAG: type II toxin-antitoxin system RelE/ParE family toxin [Planctomycetes bacterium]|nr:type II toxin-antitoxin system RelE/ParE family toxin [Planctomycetota bacterium]